MKKIWWTLVGIFVAILVALGVGFGWGLSYLNSQEGFQKVLNLVRPILNEKGIIFDVEKGHVNLFGNLSFSQVSAEIKSDQQNLKLMIKELKVVWSYSFLRRRLIVHELLLRGCDLGGELKIGAETGDEETQSTKLTVPFSLEFNKLWVDEVKTQLNIVTSAERYRLLVEELRLETKVTWEEGQEKPVVSLVDYALKSQVEPQETRNFDLVRIEGSSKSNHHLLHNIQVQQLRLGETTFSEVSLQPKVQWEDDFKKIGIEVDAYVGKESFAHIETLLMFPLDQVELRLKLFPIKNLIPKDLALETLNFDIFTTPVFDSAKLSGELIFESLSPVKVEGSWRQNEGHQLKINMSTDQVELPEIGVVKNVQLGGQLEYLGSSVNFSKLTLSLAPPLFESEFQGRFLMKTSQLSLNGRLKSKWQRNSPLLMGSQLRGEFDLPLQMDLDADQRLRVDANLHLKEVSFKTKEFQFLNVTGKVPIKEDLVLQKRSVRFSHLIQSNAFTRVAYDEIRPLLNEKESLSVQSIRWQNKELGPFLGEFEVRQNQLSIHRFDLRLSSAQLTGESFVDLHPSQFQVGLLTRFSHFDLGQILPTQYLKRVRSDKPMSGRTNLVFNIAKEYINGRVDVFDISASQLMAGLNVVDPNFEDESLNEVRGYLAYAYPTSVGLRFNHSYLDLDLKTNVINTQVKGIPISSLLNEISRQVLDKIEGVPIQ